MKRKILRLITAALTVAMLIAGMPNMLASASGGDSSLSISQTSWNVPSPNAETTTVTVQTGLWWRAISESWWLTFSNGDYWTAEQKGNGGFVISASANVDVFARIGYIYVEAYNDFGEFVEQTVITVMQMGGGGYLNVNTNAVTFTATPTLNAVVEITSNVSWTVTSNSPSWLTPNLTSGSNNGSVSLTATPNTGAARTGIITITGGGITRTVHVTQAGVSSALTVSTTTVYFPAVPTVNEQIQITSNVSWTIFNNQPSWLSVTPSSGMNNANIFISATANTGPQRTGVITITGGGVTRTITVTQADAVGLTVSQNAVNFTATPPSVSVSVNSVAPWSVTNNSPSWLTVTPTGGMSNGVLTISATANTGAQRTGIITVTGSGVTRAITVTQAAGEHIPVTSITGVPQTATAGTPLLLTGIVNPANATNRTITWSVTNAGTTGAVINGNHLYTTAGGVAQISATVVNGASTGVNYVLHFNINVTPPAAPRSVMIAPISDNAMGFSAGDALLVLKYSVNRVSLSPEQLTAYDLNLDVRVNATDALLILRIAATTR